jgi:hypothetical protein
MANCFWCGGSGYYECIIESFSGYVSMKIKSWEIARWLTLIIGCLCITYFVLRG